MLSVVGEHHLFGKQLLFISIFLLQSACQVMEPSLQNTFFHYFRQPLLLQKISKIHIQQLGHICE